MSAEVHLERQKRNDLGATSSSFAPAFAPRVPTVTLISHRELREKRAAHRLQPGSLDHKLVASSLYRYTEGSRVQKAGTMPDSPADVKTQPRSTPPTMPPPPPAVSQATSRNASFTPATSKSMLNGSSHSPTSLNGAPSTPNGFSNGPAMSSTASLSNQQLPPACGARQLCKLKRFLTTLQQFGNDISPEIGERVRSLVLGLVNSTLTIEEFHSKLHEATNFPLRPFVIPFLKANLPLLQRELLHCARLAKQTPAQYLAQHEQLLLDANASSPLDSSEIMLEMNEHGKRRTPDRTKDSSDRDGLHPEHLAKRPCTISPSQRFSPSTGLPAHPPPNGLPTHPPNGLPHPPNPQVGPQHYRLEDMALAHQYRDAFRHSEHRDSRDRHRQTAVHGARQEEVIDHRLTDREWAEEWKHLDNLLNCIMDMVEKTRRSLTVLRRCQEADREEMNHWIRRYSDVEEMKKEIHRDFLHRPPSGYLPEEIWRKAGTTSMPLSPALKHLQNKQEEAVNEVKRQAMSELQKAVSDAERKAHEMISAERSKMERALAEAKRQASEDALTVINQQEDSSESCWNCGRKASETCSGCNTARYCGSFCQHKDWEKHHHVCGQGLQGLPGGSSVPLGTPSSTSSVSSSAPPTHSESTPPGPLSLVGQSSIVGGAGSGSVSASPKESSSSSASRSTTPATPALLDATSR
ncbi:protein CBFA2T3 isoform X3 [Poecilia latipinna]|uniref:protein CBFA2T3 isoform X2 n=1 Tax=Poecilia formosa TaxID=48698 RepID=UPI0004442160|nr:PREDICTED: protein CBFA2T3 isoform X2 [Poecilia formosa]XP_014859529.1 PREDICTED: protein CBFA2T3-like isoform X3 [Poecilia mexicana]XP_014885731.1 PREDICTED: protein CBFA2T3 isoform X3 [Poecilia latipinna]